MFEQSLVESGHAHGTRKPASVLLSLGAQSLVITVAVVLPLWHTFAPTRAPVAAPVMVPLLTAPAHASAPARAPVRLGRWSIPRPVAWAPPVRGRTAIAPAVAPAWLGGGLPAADAAALPALAPPPAPPAEARPAPATPAPLAVGGEVEAARCLACPPPAYPAFAREARIQGSVVLRADISATGAVVRLQCLSGNAVLASAAERAVERWHYRPLWLDGRAVPIETVITVRFTLR